MNEHVNENEHTNNASPSGGGFQPGPPYGTDDRPVKQSGLGIASFIIGLVSILTFIVCIAVVTTTIMDYITEDGKFLLDAETFASSVPVPLIISSLLMLASLGLAFIGLILGIVGACQKRRKAFSIIGIVLNGLLVVGTVGLFLFGLAKQGAV